jgi:putative MATE family efflux protein
MFKANTDLLNGSILKSLVVFAVPLFLSNLFQLLYSTADMVIVGHFLGETSLAAIGASVVLLELLVGFAIGLGAGFGIVVARTHGSGNKDLLKRAVAGAVILGGVPVILISIAASLFLMPLLRLLNTPVNIIHEAYSYISILIAFIAVLFAYNLCAGLMRSIGNSVAPLIFLIFSSVLNIGLDVLFIIVFNMGIRGVAMATVISQAVSVVLCLIYIFKRCPELVPHKKHFYFSAALYKELAAQGFSMGFMMSIVTIGSVMLQRAINSLGTLVIAGHVAARRLSSLFMMPLIAIAVALSTFVSQNKGANRLDRIRKSVRYGNVIAVVWSVLISVILMFTAPFLARLLSGSDESVIIENSSRYLMVNTPFFMVLGVLFNMRFSLQAIGKKISPLISSVIELAGKILFAFLIVPATGYFSVIICEPILWCLMLIQLLYSFYSNPYIRGETASF